MEFPCFCDQKTMREWRLVPDLRKINAIIEDTGTLQPGLPSPTMLPQSWPIIAIDLKDLFF